MLGLLCKAAMQAETTIRLSTTGVAMQRAVTEASSMRMLVEHLENLAHPDQAMHPTPHEHINTR